MSSSAGTTASAPGRRWPSSLPRRSTAARSSGRLPGRAYAIVKVPDYGWGSANTLGLSAAGLAMPALMGFAMSSATSNNAGLISGLFATGAQLGGALGLAVLTALATARTNALLAGGQATAPALTSGYHLAFSVSTAIAGSGILLAATMLRLPAPPAMNTEDPRDKPASIHTEGQA